MSSGDCGIFICKFVEFMIQNKSHQLIQAYRFKDYRYTVELYNHGDIKSTKKFLGQGKHC